MSESTQSISGANFSDMYALGKRLRRLSQIIDHDAKRIYDEQNCYFEQRWFGVLNQINANGPLTVKSIAEALSITHASVSETRKSLETAKLIKSSICSDDKRQRLLSLTPSGKTLFTKLAPVWAAMDAAAKDLDEEVENLILTLDRLDAALSQRSLLQRVNQYIPDSVDNNC